MSRILVRFHQNHASDAAYTHIVHMEDGWKKDTVVNGIKIKILCIDKNTR